MADADYQWYHHFVIHHYISTMIHSSHHSRFIHPLLTHHHQQILGFHQLTNMQSNFVCVSRLVRPHFAVINTKMQHPHMWLDAQ